MTGPQLVSASWRAVRAIATAAVFSAFPIPAAGAVQIAGSVTTCQTAPGVADCALNSGGRIRLELLRDDIVHVRVSTAATFRDRPTGALIERTTAGASFQTFDAGDAIFLISPKLAVLILKSPLRVVMWRSDGSLVSVDQEENAA